MNARKETTARLPVRRSLAFVYVTSLVIAALMTTASMAGLLDQARVYPTDELIQSFAPNDVVNLLIGLPIMVGSMWLAWRGSLLGLLLWPGALFYVFYTYTVYIFSMPLNLALLSHLALVALSAYALIGLLASIDSHAVQQHLAGAVPERFSGGVVAGLGLLLFVRVVVVLLYAIRLQTLMPPTDLALNAADFLLAPAWIVGGVLLWRREPFGYVTGLGLLFQASMLFVGLIIILILRPVTIGAQFVLSDVLVVLAMGLVCFVPFARFARGAASKRRSSFT